MVQTFGLFSREATGEDSLSSWDVLRHDGEDPIRLRRSDESEFLTDSKLRAAAHGFSTASVPADFWDDPGQLDDSLSLAVFWGSSEGRRKVTKRSDAKDDGSIEWCDGPWLFSVRRVVERQDEDGDRLQSALKDALRAVAEVPST